MGVSQPCSFAVGSRRPLGQIDVCVSGLGDSVTIHSWACLVPGPCQPKQGWECLAAMGRPCYSPGATTSWGLYPLLSQPSRDCESGLDGLINLLSKLGGGGT